MRVAAHSLPARRVLIAAALLFVASALVYPLRMLTGSAGGPLMQNLPAFGHAAFFAVLWAWPLTSAPRAWSGAILTGAIVSAFEAVQLPAILNALPWLPASVQHYGAQGTFDPADLAAGLAGALTAPLAYHFITGRTSR